jgi:hypothetical protein
LLVVPLTIFWRPYLIIPAHYFACDFLILTLNLQIVVNLYLFYLLLSVCKLAKFSFHFVWRNYNTQSTVQILGNLPTVYFHLSVCKLQSLRAVLDSLARSEAQPTSNLASSILSTTSPAPLSFSPFTPTPPPAQWALSPYEAPPENEDLKQEDNAHNVEPKGGVKELEDLGQHAPLVDLRLCVEAAAVEVSLGDTLVPQSLMGGAFVDGKVVLQLGDACIG